MLKTNKFNGKKYDWNINAEGMKFLESKYGCKCGINADYKEFCTNNKIERLVIGIEYVETNYNQIYNIKSWLIDSKGSISSSDNIRTDAYLIPMYVYVNPESVKEEDLNNLEFIKSPINEVISSLAQGESIFNVDKIQSYCDEVYRMATENNVDEGSIF